MNISIGEISHPVLHIPRNSHGIWEVVYYTAGEGINIIRGEKLRFYPGHIIFQPPGYEHEESSQKGFQNYFLLVDFDFGSCFGDAIPEFNDFADGRIKNIFYNLSMHQRDGGISPDIAGDYISVLIKLCLQTERKNKGNPYIERIKARLSNAVCTTHYRVADAFSGIPLSKDYARLLFSRETGMTPQKYLLAARTDRAKLLLCAGALPLKIIARETGFDDVYHFSRVFKKATGMSPSKWRNERRNS